MATHNDITGDALISRTISRKYAENFDKIKNAPEETRRVEILYCDACNIKVSTFNSCCPRCDKLLNA